MIHVDHASVGQPGTFTVGDIANARRRAAEFFGRNRRVRLQESFDFPPLWDDTGVRVALDRVFGAKCALCETPANEAEGGCRADQFRPRSGAVGQDGTVDPDHYWWLAYEWRNLYLVCATCSRNKGNRFPVRGPRAKPESSWPEVDR